MFHFGRLDRLTKDCPGLKKKNLQNSKYRWSFIIKSLKKLFNFFFFNLTPKKRIKMNTDPLLDLDVKVRENS